MRRAHLARGLRIALLAQSLLIGLLALPLIGRTGASWIWLPLAVLIAHLLVPTVMIGGSFLLARSHQGRAAPPTTGADWWRAFTAELWLVWRLYLWRQPFARTPSDATGFAVPTAGGFDAAGEPVLLVHGFLCNHRLWDRLSTRLATEGMPARVIDLEPVFGSIDDYAVRIDAAVQAHLAQTGCARLSLVAHSMGGLAVRAWLRAHPERLAQVNVVVTLGTPHAGTRLRAPGFAINAAQMRHRSAWLASLARSESATLRERFRVCLTLQDEIVFPQAEQHEAGMSVHVVSGHGHLELCESPAVADWIVDTIRTSSPSGPARG